jgi:glucose-1-phosphate thymidylyltransferase
MIGVIPAAGKGKRLGTLSKEIPKPLVEIRGRTLLERCIESLKNRNINKIIVIVGYKKEKIIDFLNSKDFGLEIETIEQREQKGLAHALLQLENKINEPMIIRLPDNVIEDDYSYLIEEFEKRDPDFIQLVRIRDDPEDPIPALVMEGNNILNIIKDYGGKDGFRGVPIYIIKPIFFKYCRKALAKLKEGEELRETTVMKEMIEDGRKLMAIKFQGSLIDITTDEDVERENLK